MKTVRGMAVVILIAVAAMALFGPALAPFPYDRQFRDATSAPPGGRFPLGTDALGRDRLSRLFYASRTSIVLAPAAAAISVAGKSFFCTMRTSPPAVTLVGSMVLARKT